MIIAPRQRILQPLLPRYVRNRTPFLASLQNGPVDFINNLVGMSMIPSQIMPPAQEIPAGCAFLWTAAEANIPPGYILGVGQDLSSKSYPRLWALWGTFYGAGDGDTTDFTAPDCRGRFILCPDNMGGTAASRVTNQATATDIGVTGGAEEITLTGAQSGTSAHTHDIDNHDHSYTTFGASGTDWTAGTDGGLAPTGDTTGTAVLSANASTEADAGSAHNNLPPFITFNMIIKT